MEIVTKYVLSEEEIKDMLIEGMEKLKGVSIKRESILFTEGSFYVNIKAEIKTEENE